MSAKVMPAERNLRPFMSDGLVMQPFLEAMPPANQASDSTITPCFSMSARICFMKAELLMRLARSWLRIRPGISVAPKAGTLPLA